MDWTKLIANILIWQTVISSWLRNVGKLYFSGTPENVEVDLIDENGNLVKSTLPNVAQFRKQVWDSVNSAFSKFDTTFYVDAILGDDTNDGSSSKPFKTLKKAISETRVRGTILLRTDIILKSSLDFVYVSEEISIRSESGQKKITIKIEISNNLYYRSKIFEFRNSGNIQFSKLDFNFIKNSDTTKSRVQTSEHHSSVVSPSYDYWAGVNNVGFYSCNIELCEQIDSFVSAPNNHRASAVTLHVSLFEVVATEKNASTGATLASAKDSILTMHNTYGNIPLELLVAGVKRDENNKVVNIFSNNVI